MNASSQIKVWVGLALLLIARLAVAQTSCGTRHSDAGLFICYPNPSEDTADSNIPDLFHFSAQANAPEGKVIANYSVAIDERTVYQSTLPAPLKRVSVEMNLQSPFHSGLHSLRLVVRSMGSAEVSGLAFYVPEFTSICDPFSRSDPRACSAAKGASSLLWSVPKPNEDNGRQASSLVDGFVTHLALYSRNLKGIEADASDAIAVDSQGSLYVASHVFSDIELRKYSRTGGIVYDALIRSCGEGFLSVTALAITDSGLAWIAGNTTACVKVSSNVLKSDSPQPGRVRGFVTLVDTAKSSSAAPQFATYLSSVEYQIHALRADTTGNVYVAGTTPTMDFPHDSLLDMKQAKASSDNEPLAFVSVLSPLGGAPQWSTLIKDAKVTALAVDSAGDVYLTGRGPGGQVLAAKLADRGRRFSYVSSHGSLGIGEGRAISTSAKDGRVFVIGVTEASKPSTQNLFFGSVEPCLSGRSSSHVLPLKDDGAAPPSIAVPPALDAYVATLPQEINHCR